MSFLFVVTPVSGSGRGPSLVFLFQSPFELAVVDAGGSFHVSADGVGAVLLDDLVLHGFFESLVGVHHQGYVVHLEVGRDLLEFGSILLC